VYIVGTRDGPAARGPEWGRTLSIGITKGGEDNAQQTTLLEIDREHNLARGNGCDGDGNWVCANRSRRYRRRPIPCFITSPGAMMASILSPG